MKTKLREIIELVADIGFIFCEWLNEHEIAQAIVSAIVAAIVSAATVLLMR